MKSDDTDSDAVVFDLDKRRPRPGFTDRSHVSGALWALIGALDWCQSECVDMGAPAEAREIDACSDRLYEIAARLYEARKPSPS